MVSGEMQRGGQGAHLGVKVLKLPCNERSGSRSKAGMAIGQGGSGAINHSGPTFQMAVRIACGGTPSWIVAA